MFPTKFMRSMFCAAMLLTTPAHAGQVTVFAAASMKTALDMIAQDWSARTGDTAAISYAGSSALARQIEAGAPADVFISANVDWMDRLQEAGLIQSATRFDLVANSLVLIAHGPDAPQVPLTPETDLAAMLGNGKLAMALVDAVPAGIYGKAALENLGLWPSVAQSVAQADNVRAALALVAAGEAPYGIVYATDAVAEPRVSVAATFAPQTHPPIIYPAAVTTDSTGALALSFLDYLRTDAARTVFMQHGFRIPK